MNLACDCLVLILALALCQNYLESFQNLQLLGSSMGDSYRCAAWHWPSLTSPYCQTLRLYLKSISLHISSVRLFQLTMIMTIAIFNSGNCSHCEGSQYAGHCTGHLRESSYLILTRTISFLKALWYQRKRICPKSNCCKWWSYDLNPLPALTLILYNHINGNLLVFALHFNLFLCISRYPLSSTTRRLNKCRNNFFFLGVSALCLSQCQLSESVS